jgi:hypothetical protein
VKIKAEIYFKIHGCMLKHGNEAKKLVDNAVTGFTQVIEAASDKLIETEYEVVEVDEVSS